MDLLHGITDPVMYTLLLLLSGSKGLDIYRARKNGGRPNSITRKDVREATYEACAQTIGRLHDTMRSISDTQKSMLTSLGTTNERLAVLVSMAKMKWGG